MNILKECEELITELAAVDAAENGVLPRCVQD